MSTKIIAKNAADFIKVLDEHEVQFIDFNFTDLRGKWQHTAQHADTITKEMIETGIYFDGSSISGWKSVFFALV